MGAYAHQPIILARLHARIHCVLLVHAMNQNDCGDGGCVRAVGGINPPPSSAPVPTPFQASPSGVGRSRTPSGVLLIAPRVGGEAWVVIHRSEDLTAWEDYRTLDSTSQRVRVIPPFIRPEATVTTPKWSTVSLRGASLVLLVDNQLNRGDGLGPWGLMRCRLQLQRVRRGDLTPVDSTMLSKTVEGVLIQSQPKEFADGGGGFFCSVLQKDGTTISFWAARELAVRVSHPHDVDVDGELPAELVDKWKLTGKPWEGKVKWSLVE